MRLNWKVADVPSPARSEAASTSDVNQLQTSSSRTAMLVLSRKKNESIIIDENIVVTIVEIRGGKVRLGIEAPRDVTVHRREVYDAIKKSERADKG